MVGNHVENPAFKYYYFLFVLFTNKFGLKILGHLRKSGRIILNRIFKKHDMQARIAVIWIRIGSGVWLL
jgi:hypothetical protein